MKHTLEEALENKRNADIYIIAKRNGNIRLEAIKTIIGTELSKEPKRYIPCGSQRNKLCIEVNPGLPLKRLNYVFRRFKKRCEYYIFNGNEKINKSIEKELLEKD